MSRLLQMSLKLKLNHNLNQMDFPRSFQFYLSSSPISPPPFMFVWLILLSPLLVHSLQPTSRISFSSSSSPLASSTYLEADDTFIMNLINQEEFAECSVLLFQDRFDNDKSADRILEKAAAASSSASSSFAAMMKSAYSIKYIFPGAAELEDIGMRLKDLKLKLANAGNDSLNVTRALMSRNTLPVQFPISVSNIRKRSSPCLLVILMLNDLRPEFIRQVGNMLAPVYIPITRLDEDYFIFKSKAKLHKKLLLMPELPHRIKFKIAVGAVMEKRDGKQSESEVTLRVRTVCFFCSPGGNPRLLELPVTNQNQPRADTNYFPDFVWDLNGKLLYVSLPYIRAKIEADPPWQGTFNARRGNWKMLFEKFLTVKFNFTYSMFVSTGMDGNKGGGGTGLQLPNKTWIGVTGDLISGKADLGIVIANTPKRIHYIDFTNSFYDIGCLTFVTAQPTRIYSPAALLWPFDLGMWAGIGMSTLLSIIFFFTFFKIMEVWHFSFGEKWSLSEQIQFLLSTFLDQDAPLLPKSQAMRSFVALWLFFTMVITNVYRSKMVTLLAFPVVGKLPKTFEELAFSAASTDPVYVKLVAEMEIFAGVGLQCLERVIKYKYGCIAYDFALVHLKERNLSDSDTRKLVFAPARTYNIWLGLGTSAKSKYRMNFSKWLSYTRQFHLADIWDKMDMYYNVRMLKREWWMNTGQTDKMKHMEEPSSDLTLRHIAGAFYVLIAALIISMIVFLQEIISFHRGALYRGALNAIPRWKGLTKKVVNRQRVLTEMTISKPIFFN